MKVAHPYYPTVKRIIYVCAFMLLMACTNQNHCTISSFDDQNVVKEISRYIDKTSYDSYAVVYTSQLTGFDSLQTGILIGPFYKGLIEQLKISSIKNIGECSNRKIYLLSTSQTRPVAKDLSDIAFCSMDSSLVTKDREYEMYTKNCLINFLRKSVLMYNDKTTLIINQRPDTLVLPKIEVEIME